MRVTVKSDIGSKIREYDVMMGRVAEELYNEFVKKRYIERLKKIAQLGSINVVKEKKRFRI